MEKKIVLVTGASSGIGKEIANMLADEGYVVYGTSRVKGSAEDALQSVEMLNLDVTSSTSINSCIEKIIEKHHRIDVVVNCAGFGIAGSVEGVPISACQKQFDVNFFGCVRVIQSVLPYMRKQRSGHIINIGSVAGYIPIPYQCMYSASKFAVESLSETLYMELKQFGIKVSLIEPGDTKTGFTGSRQMAADENIEKYYMPKCDQAIQQMEKDENNGYSPKVVAKGVLNVLKSKRPAFRVNIGLQYKIVYLLSRLLPCKLKMIVLDWIY